MTFRITLDLDRPRDQVFAVVADARTMPRWYSAVEDVTPTTTGTIGVGARYDVVRSLPGGRVHNDVEITEHQPDRLVTFESRSGPTPFRYRYTLEPLTTAHGAGTRLRLEGSIDATGLPGPLGRLGPMASQLFKHGMRDNLAELKRLVETS